MNSVVNRILFLSLFVAALLILHTSLAWGATVGGEVQIEGRQDKSGVLVTIQEKNLSGITNRDGKYSISDVPVGAFTINAQKPGCLVEVYSDVVVSGGYTEVNFQLIPGDLKIDNQINLLDRIMLTRAWGAKTGDANWDSMLDIKEDGVIDEQDKALLLSNWRKSNLTKLGSLTISSEPNGATIWINGADTGKVTPYNFLGMVTGEYKITLKLGEYTPMEFSAQIEPNASLNLDKTLDNQPPEFVDWLLEPENLTEDTKGKFRVSVQIEDRGGSGLTGKTPQIDYRIGSAKTYDGYENMTRKSDDVWYHDISEPVEGWNAHRNEFVYYKVKITDVAGNLAESAEQTELIDDINDPPTVNITSSFGLWEKGFLKIAAEASDEDGSIAGVKFEYSFNSGTWTQIGSTISKPPYSVSWETTIAAPDVKSNVMVRATATDDDNATTIDIIKTAFNIDNQPPITDDDYDGKWHKEDFVIELTTSDGTGIGVSQIIYKLNNGNERKVTIDGKTSASVTISNEGQENLLEYWSEDKLGNVETSKTVSDIRLDKTPPEFSEWQQDPANLTEDTLGKFQVTLKVTDGLGSGLKGKPQLDYYIGSNAQYTGYGEMASNDGGKTWHFEIAEPLNGWNAHRGEFVYYKIKSEDIAGNIAESSEKSELIDDINDLPSVNIVTPFHLWEDKIWEKGLLKLEAEASDTDGTIKNVQFKYSFNRIQWLPIGQPDSTIPFSVEWDTASSIPKAQEIYLQAIATDSSSDSVTYIYPTEIGVDNEAPITAHDYGDSWRKEDFTINLTANDGNGVGVLKDNIRYILDNGAEKTVSKDGQPRITKEGISNLEYWSLDNLGNTEFHRKLENIRLDKTKPSFIDWTRDPDITEDSTNSLQVSVRIVEAGSGLNGNVPQFSYRIGKDGIYTEYADMTNGNTADVWYYMIPQPQETWNTYRNQYIYYKVKAVDLAGNVGESIDEAKQRELIEDINDPPKVSITSSFNTWESGSLTITAEASDEDGLIASVRFEYSLNEVLWKRIGEVASPPYTVTWNTKESITGVEKAVKIRAIAKDEDGDEATFIIPKSFSVDNQPPSVSHDYISRWYNQDFVINLTARDEDVGIGLASVSYKLNDNNIQEIQASGQQKTVPVEINTEGSTNTLEYWATDMLGNKSSTKSLSGIRLDKTPPVFSDWRQEPIDLTEDIVGIFTVSVLITDENGSGLQGPPEIDYVIGTDAKFDESYEKMTADASRWLFKIPEPQNTWDSHRNEYVYYKVVAKDAAGNTAVSPVLQELVDALNDRPTVAITSVFENWVSGKITIQADAVDIDNSKPIVQFEYSADKAEWKAIGNAISEPPYLFIWDTTKSISGVSKTVWIRATATDADDPNVSVQVVSQNSFGIDNEPPTLSDWAKSPENLTEDTKGNFRVQVNVSDGNGIGVKETKLSYKIGDSGLTTSIAMQKGSNSSWISDIPEPPDSWNNSRGKKLFYRATATDELGNISPETSYQEELIDDINDPPTGTMEPGYKEWERGSITVQAEASDEDGTVNSVQFQFSQDNVNWSDIGAPVAGSSGSRTYAVTWNTATVINADPDVWLRVVITDDKGASTQAKLAKSFGIDNVLPEFVSWNHGNLTEDTTEPFLRVEVEIKEVDSGLKKGNVQLQHRVGTTGYSDYDNMILDSGKWFYDIFKGDWSALVGKTLYYRVKAIDTAGNQVISEERSEFIDPTTGSISGTITPVLIDAVVIAQKDDVDVKQVPTQLDGTYNIIGLRPDIYDLVVMAKGYGIDRSMTDIEVKAGVVSSNHSVELYKYSVKQITSSQGGAVEFEDEDSNKYKLIIEGNVLPVNGKVLIGFSDKEPENVPNPNVDLIGRAIGIGFEGKYINGPVELVMPRPSGTTDTGAIMAFIYDGTNYKLVGRSEITANDTTITINITPGDIQNFSDGNHDFDKVLSRTADTVFYALITRFDEPEPAQINLGIRDPELLPGAIPAITEPDPKIALLIHGATSGSGSFGSLINALKAMNYYDHILVFNYNVNNSIGSNTSFLMSQLGSLLDTDFDGKIDVVAHGMGALIARNAINNGGDNYIGSLVMLGAPNGGVDTELLKTGFAGYLKQTQSERTWTYYRNVWQQTLAGSAFILALNNQASGTVNTHYYAVAASNSSAPTDATNNDGLVYVDSVDFTDSTNFPNIEHPLTESLFEKVSVALPGGNPTAFMANTRHVAMISSTGVISKVIEYLQGDSENVKYERYEGELVPGQRLESFTVVLKNTGLNTVYGVSAILKTEDENILKYSGLQGIEHDTFAFGDITAGSTKSGIFSFNVSPDAVTAIGEQVEFSLIIRNSKDNSVSIRPFTASIGGNLIQINLNQSGQKIVSTDVKKDVLRPDNDNDIAVEPGEIMKLDITLKNSSSTAIGAITAILRTDDTRVTGLDVNAENEIDLVQDGIVVSYGTMSGNTTKVAAFKFVKINDDFVALGDQVHFTLDIKSGGNFIGSDEFDVKIGSDIIMSKLTVDPDLEPGGAAEDMEIELRNITSGDITDIEVQIDWEPNVVTIVDDKAVIDRIRALDVEDAVFSTQIDADFAGYVTFTIEIEVDNDLINIETFKYYFGKRTQYVMNWVTADDGDNDKIADPNEEIKLQIARWNPTDSETPDVEGDITTTDSVIVDTYIYRASGDYQDIPANSFGKLRREHEMTIAGAGNFTVGPPSGSILTADTLQLPGANWIPDAFIGGTLNPNTGQSVVYPIVSNDEDTITVNTTGKADMDTIAVNGNAFKVVVDGDPFNDFELKGHTVEFTLAIREDGDSMGEEKITMRIGGMIKYLPPQGYDQLLATISDRTQLSANNNGNGIPEPGEIIEIKVTLVNTTNNVDVENIEAELDTEDRDIDIDDSTIDYGDIDGGDTTTMEYLFEIDTDIFERDELAGKAGTVIKFTLGITGDVDGDNEDLGTDVFFIPVKNTQ